MEQDYLTTVLYKKFINEKLKFDKHNLSLLNNSRDLFSKLENSTSTENKQLLYDLRNLIREYFNYIEKCLIHFMLEEISKK